MPKIDPVDAMLAQKLAACISIRKAMRLAKSKKEKGEWEKRLKKETAEIGALVSVQRQLLALRTMKAAARGA